MRVQLCSCSHGAMLKKAWSYPLAHVEQFSCSRRCMLFASGHNAPNIWELPFPICLERLAAILIVYITCWPVSFSRFLWSDIYWRKPRFRAMRDVPHRQCKDTKKNWNLYHWGLNFFTFLKKNFFLLILFLYERFLSLITEEEEEFFLHFHLSFFIYHYICDRISR